MKHSVSIFKQWVFTNFRIITQVLDSSDSFSKKIYIFFNNPVTSTDKCVVNNICLIWISNHILFCLRFINFNICNILTGKKCVIRLHAKNEEHNGSFVTYIATKCHQMQRVELTLICNTLVPSHILLQHVIQSSGLNSD